MSVLLHLSSVLLLFGALNVIVLGYHFLALCLSEILHGLDGPFVHPTLVTDILENLGNILIKSFIDCGLVIGGDVLVDLCHEPVEEPHDELIIIAVFPVGEHHIAFLK